MADEDLVQSGLDQIESQDLHARLDPTPEDRLMIRTFVQNEMDATVHLLDPLHLGSTQPTVGSTELDRDHALALRGLQLAEVGVEDLMRLRDETDTLAQPLRLI